MSTQSIKIKKLIIMILENRKTKIVASIGPASDSSETLEALAKAGVSIFRFNMKHEPAENYRGRVQRAQDVIKKLEANIGILFDLQGPDIRVDTKNAAKIELVKGEKVFFGPEFNNDEKCVKISHSVIFEELNIGDSMLIDDGFYEFKVIEKINGGVYVEALENSFIKNRKGLNIPDKKLSKIPSLTQDDLDKLDLAAEMKPDFIAISFCRSKQDVENARNEMKKRNLDAWIVSKIENQEGLNNLDEIIDASDAIMIARGDLGIEIPIEKIASVQKDMAYRCRAKNKPVITATQMLESMTENSRPTRAEATDVSNAIMYGTDATMLSGETAAGKDPVNCVKTMAKIALYNEEFVPTLSPDNTEIEAQSVSQLLARTCVSMALDKSGVKVNRIIAITESGFTAKVLSSYRLKTEILAVTDEQSTAKHLAISYGVKGIYVPYKKEATETRLDFIINQLKTTGYIKTGDNVLLVCGNQLEIKNLDNSLKVITIE